MQRHPLRGGRILNHELTKIPRRRSEFSRIPETADHADDANFRGGRPSRALVVASRDDEISDRQVFESGMRLLPQSD
jgi:hypothetical protein